MVDDTTAKVPAIYGAICEVMNAVPYVGKTETSEDGQFRFRGIDQILDAVGPKLREHCVFAVPRLVDIERSTLTSRTRNGLMNTVVKVEFEFVSGADGSTITVGPVPGEAMDSGDKSTGKAMSVAYRTALIQLLAIPTGDPDPDHDVYHRAPAGAAPTSAPTPPRRREHRSRPARTESTDVDPWANSDPERVKFYRDAIAATDTDAALKVIWAEITADIQGGRLAAVDGNELKAVMQHRIAAVAQTDADAAAGADAEPVRDQQ